MMNRRWAPFLLLAGLAVGLAAGYALGRFAGTASSVAASPAATPDQVIAHVDFKAAVAWAGQGRLTVEPLPVESLNATEFKPLSRASQGGNSSRSVRHMARCTQPLTIDEQQTFFNRFTNQLSDALEKHSHPGGGGTVGMLPNGRLRLYCQHSDFNTGEDPNLGTVGGVRGTATTLMVSDGESSTLLLTLTEVSPG